MAAKPIIRDATHAGSWYSSSQSQLSQQLDSWLEAVQSPAQCIGPLSEGETIDQLPIPNARAIIAPYVIHQPYRPGLEPR